MSTGRSPIMGNPNIEQRVSSLEKRYTDVGLNTGVFPISDAIDSDRSDISASSKAVKTAYDAGTRYATTEQQGQVILSHDVNSGEDDKALTPFGAKQAYESITSKIEHLFSSLSTATIFLSSGHFVAPKSGLYLIIGTGGGGGSAGVFGTFDTSGSCLWGGAGGIETAIQYLEKGVSYPLIVGQGGAGGPGVRDNRAEAGTGSSFNGLPLGGGGSGAVNENGTHLPGAAGKGFFTTTSYCDDRTSGYGHNLWGIGPWTGCGGRSRTAADGNGTGFAGQSGNVIIISFNTTE